MELSNELPFEILYNIQIISPDLQNEIIDGWDRITYTEHYIENSQEIILSRFANCTYDHIPGLSDVFEQMALNLEITPLSEWEKRGFINNNNNN